MKAVIMAGGEGTRLRPLTSNQPKPMVPMVNRPLMEHIVLLLKKHGITDIVVTVQFLASLVRTYFGDGEDLGVSLAYATEESPLGTAGSVKNAEGALDETFLVISGDALTDIDLEKVAAFHREKGALATVVLSRQPNPLEYGIVIADERGPHRAVPREARLGAGLQRHGEHRHLRSRAGDLRAHPGRRRRSTSRRICSRCSSSRARRSTATSPRATGATSERSRRTCARTRTCSSASVDTEIAGFEIADGVWIDDGAIVDPDAKIDGPVVLGEHAKVEAGAHIREFTVIGNNSVVKSGAFLHRAIIHDNAYVGEGVNLRGCILGRNADVRRGARLEEGVVLGDEGFVGENAVLQPNVKVYPFKSVEAGAVIGRSIIWESRGTRTLFGHRGVSGLINIDITPGTRRPPRRRVRRDAEARLDGGHLPRPVPRRADDQARVHRRPERVRDPRPRPRGRAGAGRALPPPHRPRDRRRLRRDGPRRRRSRSRSGSSTPPAPTSTKAAERAIERVYFREDARRAFPDEIGELRFPPRALEFYQAGLLSTLDVDAIRRANVKAVVDCAFGPTALVLPGILGRLGTDILTVNSYVDENRTTMSEEERATGSTILLLSCGRRARGSARCSTRWGSGSSSCWRAASRCRPNARFSSCWIWCASVAVPGAVVLPVSAPAVAEDDRRPSTDARSAGRRTPPAR